MNSKEVCQAIFQIEDDLDLFERRIGEVYFWERVRFAVYMKILMDSGVIGEPHTRLKRTFPNRAKTVLNSLGNTVAKNPYLATPKDILFFGSPRRKLQQDGKWWDIYCDPIIEDLNYTYLYLEPPYPNKPSFALDAG